MPTLQEIVNAVTSGHDGLAPLDYRKAAHATGEGDRYEERVLALVFLRCLRHRLLFQLSANNGDAGKFDDVVLVWRPERHPEAHTLLVQLKHKTSLKSMTIHSGTLLSEAPNPDFGLIKYCTSYGEITKSLKLDSVTFVLMTNACLGDSSLSMFERQDVDGVPGLELLQTGGELYRLNPNNQQVWKAVRGDTSFVEHFYLLCKQRNSVDIVDEIYGELEGLVGAGDLRESMCDSLCRSIREWMNGESVCLTSSWSKWQALVDDYIKKRVTECRAVTTGLEYCSVADIWDYMESCNPAWVRPPERGTEALSATRIHQALDHQPHIMVDVKRFRERRHRTLRCWGPFCRWLVIVEDDTEENANIFSELVNQIQNERRLVIVSSREDNCFVDSWQSSDISSDSWKKCLDVNVRLNGDRYECRLWEQAGGVNCIKSLVNSRPELLLTLARVSQPLRMGQELEPLPKYYMPRKLVEERLVTDEFFSIMEGIPKCVKKNGVGVFPNVNNIVIVQGKPGVGKSKMLSHVAEKIKERCPACWVLRVNLLEFYTVLDNRDSGASAAEDILKRTVFNKGELGRLEYALLRYSLMLSPRIVCLMDGFDEVSPDYVDKCFEMLPYLVPSRGKFFVTTRPAQVRLLEFRLGESARSLKPFSDSELECFLAHHPSNGNFPFVRALNKSLRNLLRIPLFAEMFANLPQETTETLDSARLYEIFFRNKFRRLYVEKWGDNLSAPGKNREVEDLQKSHEGQLMRLAASVLLRNTDAPAVPPLDRDYFVKAGVVYEFADGRPVFVHRTFAEHFLAKWCFRSGGEQNRAAVYREAYVNRKLEFFLESFDRRAVRGRPLLESLLDALLGGDEGKVQAALARGANPRETDACGRNALHLAAAYGVRRSLPVLKLLCRHTGSDMLSAEDGLLGWTPMRYAAEGGRWLAVQVLLDLGGDLSHLGDFQAGFYDPTNLQDIFERDGYQPLYQHIMRLQHPPRGRKKPFAQVEFAVSLMCAKMPRESISLIAKKARWEGDRIVHSLLMRVDDRRITEEMVHRATETKIVDELQM